MGLLASNLIFDKDLIAKSYRTANKLFVKPPIGLLGIDINNYSVRVIELNRDNRNGGYQVDGFGCAPIPRSAVAGNCIEDVGGVATAVSEAVSLSGSKLQRVAIAVCGSSVINKVIDVPYGLNDDELELFLSLNSEKYIPFPLDEVAMDFQKINLPSTAKTREKVLLTACRRDTIEKQLAAINSVNLSVEVVDVAPFAAKRALDIFTHSYSENEDLRLIADVGENHIVCNLIDGEGGLFVWEEAIKCSTIKLDLPALNESSEPESISEVSLVECHDQINKPSPKVFIESLIVELNRALHMACSSTNCEIKDLVLVGDAVPAVNVLNSIQDRLDAKVTMGNPFQNMALGPAIDSSELALYSSALTTACGLALRGLA